MTRTVEQTVKSIKKGKEKIGTDRSHFSRVDRLVILQRVNPDVFGSLKRNAKSDKILKLLNLTVKEMWEARETAEEIEAASAAESEGTHKKRRRNADYERNANEGSPPPSPTNNRQRKNLFRDSYRQPDDDVNEIIKSTVAIIDENKRLTISEQDKNIVKLNVNIYA
jgi:hypothetical protein